MDIKEGYVICSNDLKEKLLLSQKGFKEFIFLTPKELLKKLKFSIKKSAHLAIMQKYALSYDLALEYLDAIYYIEDKFYNDAKLDSLVSVYNFLKENDYLVYDKLFLYRLKQYPLTFLEPDSSKEYLTLKMLVSKYTSVFELNLKQTKYEPQIYEFKNILEECLFVFTKISKLIESGVKPNAIYIINAGEEYQFLFKRMAKSFHISLNFLALKNILNAKLIKEFLSLCQKESSFETIINNLDREDELYSIIIDTINDYNLNSLEPKECLSFLKAHFKHSTYPKVSYLDAVNLADENLIIAENEYAFLVNFNLGAAPKIFMGTSFLNDEELSKLGISNSYEQNILAKERLKRFIFNNCNVFISYKLSYKTDEYLPSILIQELDLKVKKEDVDFGVAKLEDDLRLLSSYDSYLKYGTLDNSLKRYGLNGNDYKSYHHQYQKLDAELLRAKYADHKLKLAYSNVKLYFACPFSYYADRILNLNEFKPQMAARLGTFAHAVLEDSYQEDFDFVKSAIKNRLDNRVDAKDDFFFSQMENILRELIIFNQKHEALATLKDIKREEHIIINKPTYSFEGFIDKMLYHIEDRDVYVAIIDYKTGKDVVSLDNIADGFHLQLPSYMYLLANYEPFKDLNLHIIGIYLQKVNIVIFDHKSSVADQLNKNFMLEGFTVADPTLIELFDPTYQSSTYIKSLGLTKDGFRCYSKVFASKQQDEIIKMVDNLIEKAASNILNGEFKIAPKIINGQNESCTFCKYKDICFYTYEDVVELEHKPFRKELDKNGLD